MIGFSSSDIFYFRVRCDAYAQFDQSDHAFQRNLLPRDETSVCEMSYKPDDDTNTHTHTHVTGGDPERGDNETRMRRCDSRW